MPLWVGDAHDQAEPAGEGGDLSTQDRQAIERHLEGCASCRQRRASLEQALGALGVAAIALPAEPDSPSLWPALERRIQGRNPRVPARRSRATRGLLDRCTRATAFLVGDWPLLRAWMRDSLAETLAGRGGPAIGSRRRPGWVLGFAVAATLFGWISLSSIHRRWAESQATIRANTSPQVDRVEWSASTEEEEPVGSNLAGAADVPANQLAQAELVRTPEVPAPGHDGTQAPKQSSPNRIDYDLEHGTPMPPDARDSKVY